MAEASWVKGDDIRTVSFARDNRFVGDGFVGIAGQGGLDSPSNRSRVSQTYAKPGPAIMDLPADYKLKTKVAEFGVHPLAAGFAEGKPAEVVPTNVSHECDRTQSVSVCHS